MKYKIFINHKCYKIDTDTLPFLGEGVEGKVYKFNQYALKIYKPNRDKYFVTPTIEKIEYLSRIKTEHFALPNYPGLDKDGHLIAHIDPLIMNQKPIKNILDEPILEVIEKLKKIRQDILILNEEYVLLSECDFYRNYIYNGKFNFIDSDMYQIYFNKMEFTNLKEKIIQQNNFTINDFYVMNLLLSKFKRKKILENKTKLFSKRIIDHFNLTNIYFEDLLLEKQAADGIKNINGFIKKYKKDILSTR